MKKDCDDLDIEQPPPIQLSPRILRNLGLAVAMSFSIGVLGANAQFAVSADSDEPLDITSERLESDDNIATWSGAVRVVQGEAILTCSELIIIRTDEGDIAEIQAVGDVRYASGDEAITGDKAVFHDNERKIDMTGDVVVTQGKQVMTGEFLTYWIDTGRLRFTAPKGRRIRGIFHTKSLQNQS